MIAIAGQAALTAAFGRAPAAAPFLASRVLADGVGQAYLERVCPQARLASCDLVSARADYPEYYLGLYPLMPPPPSSAGRGAYDQLQYRVVTDAEADHRDRFVSEQPRLVWGSLMVDGPRELARRVAAARPSRSSSTSVPTSTACAACSRSTPSGARQTVTITPGAGRCAPAARRWRAASSTSRPLGPLQTLARLARVRRRSASALLRSRRARRRRRPEAVHLADPVLVFANALHLRRAFGDLRPLPVSGRVADPASAALLSLVDWARAATARSHPSAQPFLHRSQPIVADTRRETIVTLLQAAAPEPSSPRW